jgi:hypothetical protein
MERQELLMLAEVIRKYSHGLDPDQIANNGGGLVRVTEQDLLEHLVTDICSQVHEKGFQPRRFAMAALGYPFP